MEVVSILAIVNLCIYLILFANISGLCWKRIKEGDRASSKSKIVHGLLLLFSGFRLLWSFKGLFEDSGRSFSLGFMLDATAICLFFTAFVIVFFHISKKLGMKQSSVFSTLFLVVNGVVYCYIVFVAVYSYYKGRPENGPDYTGVAIVVVSYSLLSAIGFVVVGVQVWRNIMALNNKSTKQSLAPAQRRRAVMMIGAVITGCTFCFAARLVAFGKDRFVLDQTMNSSVLDFVFEYWLAEIPPAWAMMYVMRRAYKSRPLPHDNADVVFSNPLSFVLANTSPKTPLLSKHRHAAGAGLFYPYWTGDFSAGWPAKNKPIVAPPSSQCQRVELSVSCMFPNKTRASVALLPQPPAAMGTGLANLGAERGIERTERSAKANNFVEFGRTLLYEVKDFNDIFYFAVFGFPEQEVSSETPQYLGETSFSVSELMTSPEYKVTKDILLIVNLSESVPKNSGSITVQIQLAEIANIDAGTITKSYLCDINGSDKLHVREELQESPYTFQAVYQFLKLLLPVRKNELLLLENRLRDLGEKVTRRNSTVLGNDLIGDVFTEIVEDNEESSHVKVFSDVVKVHQSHVMAIQNSIELCKNAAKNPYMGLSFKPSTHKADPQLHFVAVNLYYQELLVLPEMASKASFSVLEPTATYGGITFGAPAAHAYGLRHGIRELQQRRKRALEALKGKVTDIKQAKSFQHEIESLELEIRQRHDVVLSQAVSALVTSFDKTFARCWQDVTILNQFARVGFLFQVESLLSTLGSEDAMLEDMDVAIKDLAMFSFRLVNASRRQNLRFAFYDNAKEASIRDKFLPRFDDKPMKIIIEFPIASHIYDELPPFARDSRIRVFPVLFTQGINEQQTLANTVGVCSIQETINKENYKLLEQYYIRILTMQQTPTADQLDPSEILIGKSPFSSFTSSCSSSSSNSSVENMPAISSTLDNIAAAIGITSKISDLGQELEAIGKIIQTSRREKNVEILAKTADFTRKINGARATCCKSAKDRTSMSITWEQTRLLETYHDLPREQANEVMRIMRSAGVRRENAYKNIGVDKYAFNQFQLMLIPEIYRAPKGTEGARRT